MTTQRQAGTNPRAQGTSPRDQGTNPRTERLDRLEAKLDRCLALLEQAQAPKAPTHAVTTADGRTFLPGTGTLHEPPDFDGTQPTDTGRTAAALARTALRKPRQENP
jgi:hypothetical protein